MQWQLRNIRVLIARLYYRTAAAAVALTPACVAPRAYCHTPNDVRYLRLA